MSKQPAITAKKPEKAKPPVFQYVGESLFISPETAIPGSILVAEDSNAAAAFATRFLEAAGGQVRIFGKLTSPSLWGLTFRDGKSVASLTTVQALLGTVPPTPPEGWETYLTDLSVNLHQHLGVHLHPTLSKTSREAWRVTLPPGTKFWNTFNTSVSRQARDHAQVAYFGGYVHSRERGIYPDTYYVDFNSMFASVMEDLAVPNTDSPEPDYGLEGQGTVTIHAPVAPAWLPVRTPIFHDMPDWMNLTREDFADHPKYLPGQAVETTVSRRLARLIPGAEVVGGFKYGKFHRPFGDFIHKCRSLKHDPTVGWLIKRIQNGLYGSFGILGGGYEFLIASAGATPDPTWEFYCDLGNGLTQYSRPANPPTYQCNIWATEIASEARARLIEALDLAGWDNLYYADTDGFMINQEGFDRIQHLLGSEYGQLKLVTYGELRILGNKRYVIQDAMTGCLNGADAGQVGAQSPDNLLRLWWGFEDGGYTAPAYQTTRRPAGFDDLYSDLCDGLENAKWNAFLDYLPEGVEDRKSPF